MSPALKTAGFKIAAAASVILSLFASFAAGTVAAAHDRDYGPGYSRPHGPPPGHWRDDRWRGDHWRPHGPPPVIYVPRPYYAPPPPMVYGPPSINLVVPFNLR